MCCVVYDRYVDDGALFAQVTLCLLLLHIASGKLMRFIVKACSIHVMHKDIDVWNLFVVNAEDLDLAELAVGGFGAAQQGEQMVGGRLMNACP